MVAKDVCSLGRMISADPAMIRLFQRVRRVALCPDPVLILGETGTGKEGIAKALHQASCRSAGPFEELNCGVLSGELVNSQLFGHERGAFTGAERRHQGVFERSSGGTVFLDEIGELSAGVQARLLRVLEQRRLRRVGGGLTVSCDFRLVSATHRNLAVEVGRGSFRRDLFYRVGVIVLRLPPLRQRPADIPLLARRFLAQRAPGLELSPEALDSLLRHAWPGNVRELRNLVYRLAAEAESARLSGALVEELLQEVPASGEEQGEPDPSDGNVELRQDQPVLGGRSLKRIRQQAVQLELARQRGNVTAAARVLGVARSTVYDVMREARAA